MQNFKITDTNGTIVPSNSKNVTGNINILQDFYEDEVLVLTWNPIYKQIQLKIKTSGTIIRGFNELININGNNTNAFQISALKNAEYFFTDAGETYNPIYNYHSSWNNSIIKFTSVSRIKIPLYTIQVNFFSSLSYFTIIKFYQN